MIGATRRSCARQESEDGQRTAKIRQGSAQAEEGKGEDHRGQSVDEGRSARARDDGASEEQLKPVSGPVRILVDADACPVKEEVYRVAFRREVPVRVVSNARIRVPDHSLIERVLVSDKFDAADDWIAEQADSRAVVVTGDILLADRCLKAGATVIGHNGKPFTSASIGGAIATRAIMADLRAGGDAVGGPAPFAKADRSRFLQALDEALVRLSR
jgi:uncharacterized protein YaiI (UPF0178 family)